MNHKIIRWSLMILAVPLMMLSPPVWAQREKEKSVQQTAPPGPLTSIVAQFKVSSITPDSFYLGDVWVTPPRFQYVEGGKSATVEVRVVGLDAQSARVAINPGWQVSNPAMVAVTPTQGSQVKLTVRQEGQSSVTVTSGKISRKLTVSAWSREGSLYVEIAQ